MTEPSDAAPTLEEGAAAYVGAAGSEMDRRSRVELTRFVSWYGSHRLMREMTAHGVAQYQEVHGANATELSERLLPIKAFLAHAKKVGWIENNLGVHLRVKKSASGKKAGDSPTVPAVPAAPSDRIAMTAQGLKATKAELARLVTQRADHSQAVGAAMADKDFRENAPLDAARDAQAHHEARIRHLEHQVHKADVVTPESRGNLEQAHVGSRVMLTNLVSHQSVQYTLVGPNEVDAAAGRISVASPMGQAVLGGSAGSEIEVTAPSGAIQFRIERVEG